MQTNAIQFLRDYGAQKLETDLKVLRRAVEEKRKLKDRAIAEYTKAANDLLTCEQLLALQQSSDRRASAPLEIAGTGSDQTSAVLALIRGTGDLGIRPKEISKAMEGRGIRIKPAYLHTILMRLKKRGDVRSLRGSYKAVE
jgi:hypothetical protein